MTISQLVPLARNSGLTATAAALALTMGAFGNAGGRILSGWLSDSLGRLTTLRIMVLVSSLAMPLLFAVREQVGLFYLLVIVVYWCYGTQLSVFASTTADFYGTRNLGMNYGALFTAWGAAGVLGPLIAGRVFDATKSYQYAFYAAGGLALGALAALLIARRTASGDGIYSEILTRSGTPASASTGEVCPKFVCSQRVQPRVRRPADCSFPFQGLFPGGTHAVEKKAPHPGDWSGGPRGIAAGAVSNVDCASVVHGFRAHRWRHRDRGKDDGTNRRAVAGRPHLLSSC